MRLTKYVMAAAAASMAVSPVLAAQQPAPVSSSVRAGATQGEQDLRGGGFIIALLAVAAIIAGIILISKNDDKPNSP